MSDVTIYPNTTNIELLPFINISHSGDLISSSLLHVLLTKQDRGWAHIKGFAPKIPRPGSNEIQGGDVKKASGSINTAAFKDKME